MTSSGNKKKGLRLKTAEGLVYFLRAAAMVSRICVRVSSNKKCFVMAEAGVAAKVLNVPGSIWVGCQLCGEK